MEDRGGSWRSVEEYGGGGEGGGHKERAQSSSVKAGADLSGERPIHRASDRRPSIQTPLEDRRDH